jgi:hypothetical protein
MNLRNIYTWCVFFALVALGSIFRLNQAISAPPDPVDAGQGVQELTRGPVHEAFAETVTFNPQPGIVVPKTPPAAIEELPPDQKPDGENVAWIPGYWAWDDERSDFLWVSGVWRALPPGRQWVPGYWGQSAQGFQWTSGYWADAKSSEMEYLPQPPATVEAGPNVAAPLADVIWQPGCWIWRYNRFVWRPGFWAPVQTNWIWIPAHYVCTPHGYVFVDGYWDYSVARRGVLFAPVYFTAGIPFRPGFSYCPALVINLAAFTNCLFLRPQCHHYFFGDYYAVKYGRSGFYPSYLINSGRIAYDPFFAYDRWQHRQERGWEQSVAANFHNLQKHPDLRPPHTWAAQKELALHPVPAAKSNPLLAMSFNDLKKSKDLALRFQPLNPSEKHKFAQNAKQIQQYQVQRQKLETVAAGKSAVNISKQFNTQKVKLPGSPIASKSIAELSKNSVPPKIYQPPKPNLKIDPNLNLNRSAISNQNQLKKNDLRNLKGIDPNKLKVVDPNKLKVQDPNKIKSVDPNTLKGLDPNKLKSIDPNKLKGQDQSKDKAKDKK